MGFWSTMNGIFRDRNASFANFTTIGGHAQVSDLIDNFTGKTQNDWNNKQYQLQLDQLKYNKELNERLMQREDTEYSRSISDMMSAGLNPAMLYGGSVGSLSSNAGNQLNTATSTQALPAGSLAELAGFVMNMKNVLSNIQRNGAEIENIKEDTEGKKLKNQFQQVENTFQSIKNMVSLIKQANENKAQKYNNALLALEYLGRSSDGTYPNQPVYTSGTSVGVGPFKYEGHQSRPYGSKDPAVDLPPAMKATEKTEGIKKDIINYLQSRNNIKDPNFVWSELRKNTWKGKSIDDDEAKKLRNWFRSSDVWKFVTEFE